MLKKYRTDTENQNKEVHDNEKRRYLLRGFKACDRFRTGRHQTGAVQDSVILLEQLRTIDKKRLKDRICHLDQDIMKTVNVGLMVSLELNT